MKLLHLSDLHLGKKICEMSMIEEQKYIFDQIFAYLEEHPVDAVILAGDIYDKSIPSVEAVILFDAILERFHQMKLPLLIISGNHDSAERLSCGAGVMKHSGIYFGTELSQSLRPVTFRDDYGAVNIYLLPFLRPADVNHLLDETITGYTAAVARMVQEMNPDLSQRNVIVSHQFVAGAALSESETIVGNTECVDRAAYDGFDYVALGHIHSPQKIGIPTVRYCGTPLKYSLSEVNTPKSMTIVTLRQKGEVEIDTVPLKPLHEMRKIKGSFQELTAQNRFGNDSLPSDDYIYAELTDDHDVPFAAAGLRNVYPNLISVSYSHMMTGTREEQLLNLPNREEQSPQEIFTDFYLMQHDQKAPDEIENEILLGALERIGG